MRAHGPAPLRWFGAALRLALLAAPALLMAVLGFDFLLRLGRYLLAPETPVQFVYEGSEGPVTVKAERYAISPPTAELFLRPSSLRIDLIRPRLIGPNGTLFVSARTAAIQRRGQSWRAEAKSVVAQAARRPDGGFDVASLAPKPGGDEPPPMVWFEVDEARIRYRDDAGPRLERRGLVKGLSGGIGPEGLAAAATLELEGQPPAGLEATTSESGEIRVLARADGLDLAREEELIRRLAGPAAGGWPRLGMAAMLRGEAAIELEPDQPARVWADLDAESLGLRLPGWLEGERLAMSAVAAGEGLQGEFTAVRPGLRAEFKGLISWRDGLSLQGELKAEADSPQRLPEEIRRRIPDAISWTQAAAAGPLDFGPEGLRLDLQVRAAGASLLNESIRAPSGRLAILGDHVRFRGQGGWRDAMISASVSVREGRIQGWARTPRLDLAQAADRAGLNAPLRGEAAVQAAISGAADNPKIEIDAEGRALFEAREGWVIESRRFQARADYFDGLVALRRGTIESADFSAGIDGRIDLRRGLLDLKAQVQGFDLAAFSPDLAGLAFGDAAITGPFEQPQASIHATAAAVQAYGVLIPRAQVQGRLNGPVFTLDQGVALTGSGIAEADGEIDLESGALNLKARARDLQAAAFVEGISGWMTIPEAAITGTLEKPEAEGRLTAIEIQAAGVEAESAEAAWSWRDGEVRAEGEARAGDGRAKLEGRFALESEIGSFSAVLSTFPLGRVPVASVRLGGALEGRVEGRVEARKLAGLEAEVQVQALSVDGVAVGSGQGEAAWDGVEWTGSAAVGSLERYVLLENGSFRPESESVEPEVAADLTVLDLSAGTVAALGLARIPDPSIELARILSGLEGSVSLLGRVSGRPDGPSVAITELKAAGLTLEGRAMGEVTGSASRSAEGVWSAPDLAWTSGAGALNLNGSISEDGRYRLGSLTVSDLDLGLVAAIAGEELPFSARVPFLFLVGEGTLEDPQLRGSLQIRDVAAVSDDEVQVFPVEASLENVIVEDGMARAAGVAAYEGFTARISAEAPISAFRADKPEGEVSARLDFDPRALSGLEQLLPGVFDPASSGRLAGFATLSGPAAELELNGRIALEPEEGQASAVLALAGLEAQLREARAELSLKDNALSFAASGIGSQGGSLKLAAAAQLDSLLQGEGGGDLNDVPISARLDLDSLRIEQPLQFGDQLPAASPSRAIVQAGLQVQGTAGELAMTGRVGVSQGRLVLPPELPEAGPGAAPRLNLAFRNVQLELADPASFVLPVGEVRLSGAAALNGSLASPSLRAPLIVAGGSFRLPSGEVELQPGGSVVAVYEGGSVQAQVRMEATTSIVARRLGDSYDRYRVQLRVSGDALAPEGLSIFASSDPPDLSSDEIMAVIGQKELIEGLVGSVLQDRNDEFLRGALYSFALPSLTQGISASLAESLRLDYITFEYNPFEQAIVRAGRDLGAGLQVSGYRQLLEPAFGAQRWDLRLTYRIPTRDVLISRFRLGLGSDYEVPWRIFLDWSRRF